MFEFSIVDGILIIICFAQPGAEYGAAVWSTGCLIGRFYGRLTRAGRVDAASGTFAAGRISRRPSRRWALFHWVRLECSLNIYFIINSQQLKQVYFLDYSKNTRCEHVCLFMKTIHSRVMLNKYCKYNINKDKIIKVICCTLYNRTKFIGISR